MIIEHQQPNWANEIYRLESNFRRIELYAKALSKPHTDGEKFNHTVKIK